MCSIGHGMQGCRRAVDSRRDGRNRDAMIGNLISVALGGALGSVARYLIVLLAARGFGTAFPWGTLVVNVAGSFMMGVLVTLLSMRGAAQVAPLMVAGFLGGFTTFSAFSLDAVALWERAATSSAVVYVAASVFVSLSALVAGVALVRGSLG